jgi:rhodanese-related sulfurtransferase
MLKYISAKKLKDCIDDSSELALIDIREEGDFGLAHILLCANISLSELEIKILDLVPRKSTRLVLCDAEGKDSYLGAEKLELFGYTDVCVLDGGVKAWGDAGFEVFSGLNVPSKAFGEFVEHAYGTPSVSANELKTMMENKDDIIILDSRPMTEFKVMNIPNGIDMPGAELVYRVQETEFTAKTTIIVNCAGRTRSIIGAQSLINAGVPNKVVALRNGTMGWHLAGYKLEHGMERPPPEVSEEGHKIALARAKLAAKRFGVKCIDAKTLDLWRSEQTERTLSILDVRTADEFEIGHVADSRHAAGGQLVQATDKYVATQKARVVLVDDRMVRALMTASWLRQLGWCEVFVLKTGLTGQAISTGARIAPCLGLEMQMVRAVKPKQALKAQNNGATIICLDNSLSCREKHPKGAWFSIRSRLARDLESNNIRSPLIIISTDVKISALAALDIVKYYKDVSIVEGGTLAWEAADLPMEGGLNNVLSVPNDVYLRAYDREDPIEVENAMNDYLNWELGLVEQIARPGGVTFSVFPH